MTEEKKTCFRAVEPEAIIIDKETRDLIIDVCLEQIKSINVDIELASNAMIYIAEDMDSGAHNEAVRMYRRAKRHKAQISELLDRMTNIVE